MYTCVMCVFLMCTYELQSGMSYIIFRVSEYLVCQARKQGLPIAVYRLGMISWSMKNGKANKVSSTHQNYHFVGFVPHIHIHNVVTFLLHIISLST